MSNYNYSIQYERFHKDTEEHAEEMALGLMEMLRARLPKKLSSSILDIGCGYGFALRALRKLGYSNLKGLEISSQQAARCTKAGFDVDVCSNSTAWISSYPNRFNYVLLLDVLEHIPVQEQIIFLKAINGCLKKDGGIFITTPNANSILSSRWLHNDYTHHSSFTENSLYFVLKNAGFSDIKIDNSKGIGRFPRRLWRKSSWPHVRKWLVRWCWLQVFKAEVPWDVHGISFELNLTAIATKS